MDGFAVAVIVWFSFCFGALALAETEELSRLRFKRAVCVGPLVPSGNVCRWTGLECSCVNGTFCSMDTHICEVCQITTADCTSPCQYPCRNGGVCDLESASCHCPAGYVGVDCSTIRLVPTTADPNPPIQPSLCERDCLNGGVCREGTCACLPGYFYPDCSLCVPHMHPSRCLDHCKAECVNGDCLTVNQKCHCSADYTGEDCTLCIPEKASRNCTHICSEVCINGATCNSKTLKCQCTSGWTGIACQERCPSGTYGLNCLGRCQCQLGRCEPIMGRCLCDPDNPVGPYCSEPCDCIVDGVCQMEADCPAVLPERPVSIPTTTGKDKDTQDSISSPEKFPMMTAIVATAAGAIVLLVVVVILIVCLVKSRQQNSRKLEHTEEAEQLPMTTAVAGNDYEDASSTPMTSLQITPSPFRPTSGYEDVTDLHNKMPDLLPGSDEISPYATTGNITIHTENIPSEYSYVGANELKTLQEGGKASTGEFYDKLDFSPCDKSISKPAKEGLYDALQVDGIYDDASSAPIDVPLYNDASSRDTSGYAKMSPSLDPRKTASLQQPKNGDLKFDVQRKAGCLTLPQKGDIAKATSAFAQNKQPYENTYIGFDPEASASDGKVKPRPVNQPPQPVTHKRVSPPSDQQSKREIPQYAKPIKRKSQLDQQEMPQCAKPHKKTIQPNGPHASIPQYAKPNKKLSNKSDRPHVIDKGDVQVSRSGDGYAHLMHAHTPSQE